MQKNPKLRLAPRLWVFVLGHFRDTNSEIVSEIRVVLDFGVVTLRNHLRKLHHAAHAAHAPGGS